MFYKRISSVFSQIKRLRFDIRSVWLFRFVVFIGLAPFVLALFAWIHTWSWQNHDPWVFEMIDSCLKIGEKIWAPAVAAGLLNFVPRVTDADGDGMPDVDKKKEEEKNEPETKLC